MTQASEQYAAFKKANKLSILSANCLNLHSPLADCHICETVCPQKAISFQDGNLQAQNCSLCGICAMVCPTQVFQIDLPALLHQASTPLSICCSQNTTAPTNVLRVNCIQQFNPLAIIYLLYRYPSVHIHIPTELCKQCSHQWYAQGFLQQLETYKLPSERLQLITTQNAPVAENRRRELFRDLFHRTEDTSKKVLTQAIEKISTEFSSEEVTQEEPTVFPSRLPLYALYAKKQIPLQDEHTLPFRALSCTTCTFCGACAHICPTQAIEIKKENKNKQLLFHPELCINCNLCQKICMQRGLSWEDFLTDTQFMQTPTCLAQSQEHICSLCDHEFYHWPTQMAEEEPICSFCR